MKIRGWVYVITNKAMPGLVKVGFSTKDPSLRATELSNTGSPTSFDLAYDALVFNPRDVEQEAHRSLMEYHEGKEWFRCTIDFAISKVKSASGKDFICEWIYVDLEDESSRKIRIAKEAEAKRIELLDKRKKDEDEKQRRFRDRPCPVCLNTGKIQVGNNFYCTRCNHRIVYK